MEWWENYSEEQDGKIILTMKDILLGYKYEKPPKLFNNVLIHAKLHIYRERGNLSKPNITKFIAEIKCKMETGLLL